MLKAYKYCIYPNKAQRLLLAKTFGCIRFYWNKTLEIKLKALENKEKIPQVLPAALKKEHDFLKEIDSLALANAQLQLERAVSDWFRKKAGKPKFKRKRDKQSYTTSNVNGNIAVDFEKGHVKLPKVGYVKTELHRTFTGTIKSATIRRTKSGIYFVSVLVEGEPKRVGKSERICAIDLGVKDFATICYSDGNIEKIENPKYLSKAEKRLAREQRRLSKKQKGSKNSERQRHRVAKCHEKIANKREDFLHKLSKRIVDDNQVIILEDLNVKGLLKNQNLSKSISDVSWSTFVRYLQYKALWYDKQVMFADRFYASSKLCNVCGYKNDFLTLKDRHWACPVCGTEHDRDVNASVNLLNYGLVHLKDSRAGTARTYACGDSSDSGMAAMSVYESSIDEAGSSMLYNAWHTYSME